MEKRDRDAAYATVASVDTAQYSSLRSLTPEIPPDVCVSLEEKDEEGRMNPEPTELESPSAGTVLKHPDGSVPRTGRHGRQDEPSPTAIFSLTGFESGDYTSPPTERVGTRAANPKTRIMAAKRTSNLTPEGKKRSHRLGTRL